MKNSLVNEDGSVNKEELEKILTDSQISDFYNANAKDVLRNLLNDKNKKN